MFNCTCTRHIDWTTQTPSCIRQLRILSGLLCDKPWCNPIVLTTVAVGLGKKKFIQRQLSTPMFNCSASIPPLLLPLASSFLTLFILASAYGILTGVRRCFEDFDNISLSINLNHSKTISICFKHFELSLSRRGLRQPPLSLFPSSASIFSQLPLASWQPARSSTEFQLPFASQQIYAHWRQFASHWFFGTSWKLASD